MKWTPEQELAIKEKDNHILVAAAAGSGKTAVLVERIIQKILDENDPVNIDELLVATFTNAAAEEMRQRIGLALEKALEAHPDSYHLKLQHSLLQRASISTIHSFCMNVVRQYSYMIDLDPSFRIADEMEIDLLKHEVIDELFEERYGEVGPSLDRFFAVVDMYSSDRSDLAVESLILHLHTFSKQHPWPDQWLEEMVAVYDVDEETEEEELDWLNILKDEIEDQFLSLERSTLRAIDLAREADGPYHYEEALQADLVIIREVLHHKGSWNELEKIIKSASLKRLSGKRVECDEEKKEKIKEIRERFRQSLTTLKNRWFSRSLGNHLKDMATLYPIVQELVVLVRQFEEKFVQEKRKRAIVDFNDLEHYALQILTTVDESRDEVIPSPIAEQYQAQFEEILVDEYQDINLVQETIIQSISRQSPKGNVFMVGDVKQSIYRFRHAEPSLFIQKYESFKKDEEAGKRIDLARNFRSRANILAAANFLFKQIFDPTIGDIHYDEDAALIYGNKEYDQYPLKEEAIELCLIEGDQGQASASIEEAAILEQASKVQLEARLYGQKIKEWIGHTDKEALQVYDKDERRMRPVQYRDIVILLRSMSGAPAIVEELKKQGIPVYSELRTGYFQAIEIQVMINMLKVIDNPYQDIPLVSVLRSPIVALDEDELTQIRLAKRHRSFYEALLEMSKAEGELSKKINSFLEALATYRKLARETSLSELIWTIFQETGYYDFVGGIPGGRQRQANLRALYDRARSYEETSFRGLFRFLRFIERMEEQNKDLGEARALSEQEDVVRIMTIHKSKGLEFPIVILGEVNKQFNFSDLRGDYLANKSYGFASKFIDPVKRISYSSLYYLAVNEQEKYHLLSEEMRVLYVALTRAKEKLVIVGHVHDSEEVIEAWQEVEHHDQLVLPNHIRKHAKSYLDWIGPALVRHQNHKSLREYGTMSSSIPIALKNDPSKWEIKVVPQADLSMDSASAKVTKTDLEKAIQDWKPIESIERSSLVADRLGFVYDYEAASKYRAKQSVTEIKRRYESLDEYSEREIVRKFSSISLERPKFMQKQQSLTASEIGTAMHTVMQHISFQEGWDKAKLTEFVGRLVDEEKLRVEEAQAIDIEAILHFFQTDIAKDLARYKVERELPFTYTIDAKNVYEDWDQETNEKVLIQGVIDCLIFTDDGLIILDYKTDRILQSQLDEALIEELKNRYAVQMNLYGEAIEGILKQPVKEKYVYFFDRQLSIRM